MGCSPLIVCLSALIIAPAAIAQTPATSPGAAPKGAPNAIRPLEDFSKRVTANVRDRYQKISDCAASPLRALSQQFGSGPSIWQHVWIMTDQSKLASMNESCRSGLDLLALEKPKSSPKNTRDLTAARELLAVSPLTDHGVAAYEQLAVGSFGLIPASAADIRTVQRYVAWRGSLTRYAIARFAEAVRSGDTEKVLRELRAALLIDAAMSAVDYSGDGYSCSPAHLESSIADLVDWSARFMQQTNDPAAIDRVVKVWGETPRPDLASRFAMRAALFKCLRTTDPLNATPEAQNRFQSALAFYEATLGTIIDASKRPPLDRVQASSEAISKYTAQRARLAVVNDDWPEPRRIAADLLALDHRAMRFSAIPVIAAVELHRRSTGALPKKLADIKPAIQVPVDPFSGQEIGYRARGKADFVLFSVGIDGRANDGSAAAPELVDGVPKGYDPTMGLGFDLVLNKR